MKTRIDTKTRIAIFFALLCFFHVFGETAQSSIFSGLDVQSKKEATYRFTISGKDVGSAVCAFRRSARGEHSAEDLHLQCKVDLDFRSISIEKSVISHAKATFDPQGAVVKSYSLHSSTNHQTVNLRCALEGGHISEDIDMAGGAFSKRIKLPDGPVYLVDNNIIGLWTAMTAQLNLRSAHNVEIKVFFPQSLQVESLKLRRLREETLSADGWKCAVFSVEPIGEIFWITEAGLLAKIENPSQNLRIELMSIETLAVDN